MLRFLKEVNHMVLIDFHTPYRVSVPAVDRGEVVLGGSRSFSIWEQCYVIMERWKKK